MLHATLLTKMRQPTHNQCWGNITHLTSSIDATPRGALDTVHIVRVCDKYEWLHESGSFRRNR